ncbi:DUF1192 domain-containing protein [Sabulicella glaciei]|uniref:DUF1192 domain-containing protein n=1 Tax=Sabulicella glaciei TaxID=2984948 RepID=A0ABT3NU27_9PROT|nr:DUF1192 domain-containing protein [Roseococcus sp. MDT2-1-1]MCW8085664.1 DUF1192 domain-containing protein [Roseococcus sp. MDT2-1-1]
MFEEEPRPRRRPGLEPAKLDGWDVGELRDYIEALRTEIGRAEAAIAKLDGHKSAAEAFFRRP